MAFYNYWGVYLDTLLRKKKRLIAIDETKLRLNLRKPGIVVDYSGTSG